MYCNILDSEAESPDIIVQYLDITVQYLGITTEYIRCLSHS